MSYPKWLYHQVENPKVVNNPDEHEALGAGWEESPAVCYETESGEEPKAESGSEPKRKRGKAKE